MIPQPWMSPRDADGIKAILLSMNMPKVLEYGAGWSTCVFPEFAKGWIAMEHNRDWRDTIKPHLPKNADIFYEPDELLYVHLPLQFAFVPYDLIFIDGQQREECLYAIHERQAAPVVLLHDANRQYQLTTRFPWHFKILDDLAIMGFGDVPEILENPTFERRDIDTPSYQWDPIHEGMPNFYPSKPPDQIGEAVEG